MLVWKQVSGKEDRIARCGFCLFVYYGVCDCQSRNSRRIAFKRMAMYQYILSSLFIKSRKKSLFTSAKINLLRFPPYFSLEDNYQETPPIKYRVVKQFEQAYPEISYNEHKTNEFVRNAVAIHRQATKTLFVYVARRCREVKGW